MKLISLILIFTINISLIGCTTNPNPTTSDSTNETTSQITNEDEFAAELAKLIEDYSEASFLLTVIFNTDSEITEFEDWHEWVETNLEQWDRVEQETEALRQYLSPKTSWIPQAFANNEEQGMADFVLKENETLEIDVTSPTKFENEQQVLLDWVPSNRQVIEAATSRDPRKRLQSIMEKFSIKDIRVAKELLDKARAADSQFWNDSIKSNGFIADGLTTIKNTAFTSVAIGGVVIAGGALIAAETLAGAASATVSLVIGGSDLALQAGENTAYIINNKHGETIFREARKNLNQATSIFSFINLKEGLTDAGNLITLYNYYNDSGNLVGDNQNQLDQETNKVNLIHFNLGENEVVLLSSEKAYDAIGSKENLLRNLSTILPDGATVKIGNKFYQSKDGQVTPLTPTDGIIGEHSSPLSVSVAGQTASGTLNFTVDESGEVIGNLSLSSNFQVNGASVNSTTTATLSGTYNFDSETISMTGNFNSSSNTSYGASQQESGQVTSTGEKTGEGTLAGHINFSGTSGYQMSGNWNTAQ